MSGFSTTDFASLLDEVIAAGDAREDLVRPSISIDLLNPVLSGAPINPADAADYLFTETVQRIEPDRRKPKTANPVHAALSDDPADIARELGLTGHEDAAALDRVRRTFAFINHPDRVVEQDRGKAIIRMQIANRLIDDAKAKRA
jgi:hypothetical protein